MGLFVDYKIEIESLFSIIIPIFYAGIKKNHSHFCYWLLLTELFFVLSINWSILPPIEIPTKNLCMFNYSHYRLHLFIQRSRNSSGKSNTSEGHREESKTGSQNRRKKGVKVKDGWAGQEETPVNQLSTPTSAVSMTDTAIQTGELVFLCIHIYSVNILGLVPQGNISLQSKTFMHVIDFNL